MAEHAAKGQAALDASDGLAAVGHFTNALIEHPTSPDYFTLRSAAFCRTKPPQYNLALRDAEFAILLGQQRQKREKIQAGQQRRVVALYGLKKYAEAKIVLDGMLKWRSKEVKKDKMEHDVWAAKINSKLKGKETEGQAAQNFQESPEINLPNDELMLAWLQSQLKSDGSFKFEGDEDITTAPKTTPIQTDDTQDAHQNSQQEAAHPPAETVPVRPEPFIKAVRQDWYQDNNVVTVTLYAKKVDPTKLQHEFSSDSVQVAFPHPDSSEEICTLTLNPTHGSIDARACTVQVFGTKVEIRLFKQEKGIKWPALDSKTRPKVGRLPSAWTTKPGTDWDKKAAELTRDKGKGKQKEVNDDADSDADSEFGGDAVDGFFKKLYAGADGDTRRAMMKSFQESNGTALSTNWSEVSKAKVEEVKSRDD